MLYVACAIGGFIFGVITAWAWERKRYEALLRDHDVINAALVESLDAVVALLQKLIVYNGGMTEDGQ